MKRFFLLPLVILSMLTAFVTPCWAAQYDFKQITPEIDAALKNRQSRFFTLKRLKQDGAIGENNQGYVTSLKGDSSSLVELENRDREVIYQGLVSQNQLGPQGMREVQRAFAEVQREKANAGDQIQLPSGQWVRKS